MTESPRSIPLRAWLVVAAGTAINLCLGILYAWSVWKSKLLSTPEHPPGTPMTGVDSGWVYLTDVDATLAYAVCGLTFAICMIPGGRVQDRFGPRVGATAGGLFLAAGCLLAAWMRSFLGLMIGFGLLGGVGMGLGYAAATPAAVKWFGPHRRGLIVGIVVGGYGGAAIYIAPLARHLIEQYGISGSFTLLGLLFAVVVVGAGQLLRWPPDGYTPPPRRQPKATSKAPTIASTSPSLQTTRDWTARQMMSCWQFYALVLLFIGSAQSGLLVIANATPMMNQAAKKVEFLARNSWLLASFGGLVNACGRVVTGLYSDRIGRANAYILNGSISALCLALTPTILESENVIALFLAVGVAYWQYGGGLSLLPAFTLDFFGGKNLGLNYGLVFIGWGIAFLAPLAAGYLKDLFGNLNIAFYVSCGILIATVALSRFVVRPDSPSGERTSSG